MLNSFFLNTTIYKYDNQHLHLHLFFYPPASNLLGPLTNEPTRAGCQVCHTARVAGKWCENVADIKYINVK